MDELVTNVIPVGRSSVGALLSTVALSPILYRLLGTAAFGEYSFLLAVFAIYTAVVSVGVPDGVRTTLSANRRTDSSGRLVVAHALATIGLAVLGAVALALATRTGIFDAVFGAGARPYFLVFSALVITTQIREFTRQTLAGLGFEAQAERLPILESVAVAVVVLPFVAVGFDVFGALAAHLVASVFVSIAGVRLIARRVSLSELGARSRSGSWLEQIRLDPLTAVRTVLLVTLAHVGVVLLYRFVDAAAAGTYRIALALASILFVVPLVLRPLSVDSRAESWSRNGAGPRSNPVGATIRYTFILAAWSAVVLASLADVVVPALFGPAGTSAVGPLVVMLPGAFGAALAGPVQTAAKTDDGRRYSVAATAGAAGLFVAAGLVLIPNFGVQGAAAATSIGYGSLFAFHLASARALDLEPLAGARLGRTALASALAAVPIVGFSAAITTGWLAVAIVPPVALVLLFGFGVLVGAVDLEVPFEALAAAPDPVGGWADAAYRRVGGLDADSVPINWIQRLLILVGISLLVTGLFVGLLGSGIESLRF